MVKLIECLYIFRLQRSNLISCIFFKKTKYICYLAMEYCRDVKLTPKICVMILLYRWFNKGIPQVQAEELASLSESD